MEDVRKWLEIIYFVSGPAVAVFAFLALAQVRVAKEQLEAQRRSLQIASKRDALRVTADQIMEYSTKIVPLINTLDRKIKEEKITYFSKFNVEVHSDSVKVTPVGKDINVDEVISVASEIVAVSNALEAFSSYFASGVADEKMAFLSLGTTFCDTVKDIAPLLVPLGAKDRRFAAVLYLFTTWHCRLEAEALSRQKDEIEKKLETRRPVTIKTVGVEAA